MEYGILPKDNKEVDVLQPKQCPNCNEPNRPDQKFCVKCRMVLTYDAYNETIEDQKVKGDELLTMKKQIARITGNARIREGVTRLVKGSSQAARNCE